MVINIFIIKHCDVRQHLQCADCTGCTGTGEEDVQDASSAIIATCFPVWISPHLLPLLGPGCRRIESAETDNCSPPAAAGHHTGRVLSIVSRSSHHPDSDTDTHPLMYYENSFSSTS